MKRWVVIWQTVIEWVVIWETVIGFKVGQRHAIVHLPEELQYRVPIHWHWEGWAWPYKTKLYSYLKFYLYLYSYLYSYLYLNLTVAALVDQMDVWSPAPQPSARGAPEGLKKNYEGSLNVEMLQYWYYGIVSCIIQIFASKENEIYHMLKYCNVWIFIYSYIWMIFPLPCFLHLRGSCERCQPLQRPCWGTEEASYIKIVRKS